MGESSRPDQIAFHVPIFHGELHDVGAKRCATAATLEVDDGLGRRHGHFNVRVVDGDSNEHPEPNCFRHPSASLSSRKSPTSWVPIRATYARKTAAGDQ